MKSTAESTSEGAAETGETGVSILGSRHGRVRLAALVILVLSGLAAVTVSESVWRAGENLVFDNLNELTATKVALVLGCPPRVANGNPNLYFQKRLRAASRLFQSGKVEYLLLSGDNNKSSYNEPQAMFEGLRRLGVPEDRLVRDYAGFRTLDSVVRAKAVFGQDELIVVSQEFHNRRALFLAQRLGLRASGYNAADVPRSFADRLRWREAGARMKAFADVFILHTTAKFLGEPVVIG